MQRRRAVGEGHGEPGPGCTDHLVLEPRHGGALGQPVASQDLDHGSDVVIVYRLMTIGNHDRSSAISASPSQ